MKKLKNLRGLAWAVGILIVGLWSNWITTGSVLP